MDSKPLDLNEWDFVNAFIHGLVAGGEQAVMWDYPETKLGLGRIHGMLEERVEKHLPENPDEALDLVRLRNMMQPGSFGRFEGLRSRFRERTMTLVEIAEPYDHSERYEFWVRPLDSLSALHSRVDPRMLEMVKECLNLYRDGLGNQMQARLDVYASAQRARPHLQEEMVRDAVSLTL